MTSKNLISVLLLCLLSCSQAHLGFPRFHEEEHKHFPISFHGEASFHLDLSFVVKSAVTIIQNVISTMSKHQSESHLGESRLSGAIRDCVQLMDSTLDQLAWTLSRERYPNGRANATGYVVADMKTWLSAALANQETCLQGFELEDHDPVFKKLIAARVNRISSFIVEILTHVKVIHDEFIAGENPGGNETGGGDGENAGGSGNGTGTAAGGDGKNISSEGSCKSFTGISKAAGNVDSSAGEKRIIPMWLQSEDTEKIKSDMTAHAVVAADGSGDYKKIQEAIDAAPECSATRYVIYIKKGVYQEYIEMSKKKVNIMLIGDGIDATVITGNRNYVDGWTTFRSATFAVNGEGFIARDITFENTAGPEKHQAVAFRSDSDLSMLYRCAFRGFQDTLYAHAQRQFYKKCVITGTIDFIFGDATAVFQDCEIIARMPLPGQKNIVTAQGRKDAAESTGFSLQFCNITAEPAVLASLSTVEVYLGRPWKEYSRTVILQSCISNAIRPAGWLEWSGNFALDTLYYAEYENYGPGAALEGRVKWGGYHVLTSYEQAEAYSVKYFIVGLEWLPLIGIEFESNLRVSHSG